MRKKNKAELDKSKKKAQKIYAKKQKKLGPYGKRLLSRRVYVGDYNTIVKFIDELQEARDKRATYHLGMG